MNEDIMIPFIVFAFIFATLYVYFTTRNKERMALIEKGADPALFKSRVKVNGYLAFKLGLFFMGIAIGIFAGAMLDTYTSLEEGPCYLSMIFLFGGGGLVLAHILQPKTDKDE